MRRKTRPFEPLATDRPVDLRTRFERFPATIKGAFVMAGADGNPHSVRIERVTVSRLPSGDERDVAVAAQGQIEVAPRRELFVPFEAAVSELEPGWYSIHTSLRVDASEMWDYWSRAFSVPWSRGEMRRGTIDVGRVLEARGGKVLVERVDLRPDAALIAWRPEDATEPEARATVSGPGEPSGEPGLRLAADGRDLPVLPHDVRTGLPDPPAGERRTVSYPVPRSVTSLELVADAGRGVAPERIALALP